MGSKNDLHNNYQDFQTVPGGRRPHRAATRPAAVRRLPAEPVPDARRDGPDAHREPGRGRGHQGATSACRRSTRRARSSSSARSCIPATAASGASRCAPASTRSTRACTPREIVPTSILTLNWADAVSTAHNLDAHLSPIEAKSREGFVFKIDLQVQIHVPDTRAPKVISMVGTMQNLVNEVLQAAVGNHFRNTIQDLEAVRFIETRPEVQASALEAIRTLPRGVRGRDAAVSTSRTSTSPTSWSRC